MRISLYRKGSDPNSDSPILRKSASYVRSLVANGDADWWDRSDESRGAILRSTQFTREVNCVGMIAAGTMLAAWGVKESGYAGPLVWQMRTQRDRLVTA
jgi:hypothetical protein